MFTDFRNWPLRWKIMVAPGIVVMAVVIAALGASFVLQSQKTTMAEKVQVFKMREYRLAVLRTAIVKGDLAMFRAIAWNTIGLEPGAAASLRAVAEAQFSSVAVLAEMLGVDTADDAEDAPLIAAVHRAARAYEGAARIAIAESVGGNVPMPVLAEAGRSYAEVEAAISAWEHYHREAEQQLEEQSATGTRRTTVAFLVAALAAFAAAAVVSLLVARAISAGVVGVTDALGRLAAGDTEIEIPPANRTDEVGRMLAAASVFKDSLRALDRATAERAAVEAENRVAMARQYDLLAQSEQRLRDIAQAASDWFWETDADDRLTMVSDRFFEVTGFTPEDVIGKTRFQFAQPAASQDDAAKWVAYAKDLAARRPFRNLDYSVQAHGGRVVHIRSNGMPVFDDDGGFLGYRGASSDISALIDAQREALQSSRLASVGQLAAGIAHEINTPIQYVGDNLRFFDTALATVADAVAQARAEAAADPIIAARIAAILEAADIPYLMEELPAAARQSLDGVEHVARIVRSMKTFSHPGSSAKTMTDLNRAIESTLIVTTNEWKHTARVETDLAPDLPQVLCLPAEINQVLLNLIVNASHALEGRAEPGVIRVSTRADGDAVEIRIADNGPGIPDALRERVFHPFFTTKGVGKGTGQGLAIAMDVVVKKHGGRLDLEETPGGGATFVVRLPVGAKASERAEGMAE